MTELPYMPLFCKDLDSSTRDMTTAQFGAYMRLLVYAWPNGGFPNDYETCSRIAGGISEDDWRVLRRRFVVLDEGTNEERLSHRRLESVREEYATKYKKRCESARKARQSRQEQQQPVSEINSEINSEIRAEIKAEVREQAPLLLTTTSTSVSSSLSWNPKAGFVHLDPALRAQWEKALPLIDIQHTIGKAHMHLCSHADLAENLLKTGELLPWLVDWLKREQPHRKAGESKKPAESWLQNYRVADYQSPRLAARKGPKRDDLVAAGVPRPKIKTPS